MAVGRADGAVGRGVKKWGVRSHAQKECMVYRSSITQCAVMTAVHILK